MERKIVIECANCRLEHEIPENISIDRLNDEAADFFKQHKTRIGNAYCKKSNLFLRTFKI